MGQNLFSPPNVRGWPGGDAWINTHTLLARKQFLERAGRVTAALMPAPQRRWTTDAGTMKAEELPRRRCRCSNSLSVRIDA